MITIRINNKHFVTLLQHKLDNQSWKQVFKIRIKTNKKINKICNKTELVTRNIIDDDDDNSAQCYIIFNVKNFIK